MNFEIIDNFLDQDFYKILSQDLKSTNIPWWFNDVDTSEKSNLNKNNNGFFSFTYYNNFGPDHELFKKHIIPITEKLNIVSLIQVRANLTFRDIDHLECGWHTDNLGVKNASCVETAILYLSTCNAKTILKINEKEVEVGSVENRLLLFDNNIKHKVVYQTDCHKRYVINFNFIRSKNV